MVEKVEAFMNAFVKLSEWLTNGEAKLYDAVIQTPTERLADFLIGMIPNGVGYAMIGGAAALVFSGMTGRGMMGPLGFLGGVFVLGVSVLVTY